eukprot:473328-Rhodomonas_salina.1
MLKWRESASCTDLLQKALATGCTPIRRCYLGTYMPSHLSRAHDARLSPDLLLCAAQMQNGLERAADLCTMRFPAHSAFVLRKAADLDSDARHVLWKAVRACRRQGSSV